MVGYYDYIWACYSGYCRPRLASSQVVTYLSGLQHEGYVDGELCAIKAYYAVYDSEEAICNYKRAAELRYAPAYLSLADRWWYPGMGKDHHPDRAMFALLKAENDGLRDDRLLSRAIRFLCDKRYIPKPGILGTFKNKVEMALYYCDVLIERGSPLGYYRKGLIYWKGLAGVPKDKYKAVTIWMTAHRHGLADINIYANPKASIMAAYRYVKR